MKPGPFGDDYGDEIRALVQAHEIGAHNDPGGVELNHPHLGRLRLTGYDSREDYEKLKAWLHLS